MVASVCVQTSSVVMAPSASQMEPAECGDQNEEDRAETGIQKADASEVQDDRQRQPFSRFAWEEEVAITAI